MLQTFNVIEIAKTLRKCRNVIFRPVHPVLRGQSCVARRGGSERRYARWKRTWNTLSSALRASTFPRLGRPRCSHLCEGDADAAGAPSIEGTAGASSEMQWHRGRGNSPQEQTQAAREAASHPWHNEARSSPSLRRVRSIDDIDVEYFNYDQSWYSRCRATGIGLDI